MALLLISAIIHQHMLSCSYYPKVFSLFRHPVTSMALTKLNCTLTYWNLTGDYALSFSSKTERTPLLEHLTRLENRVDGLRQWVTTLSLKGL
jgi:hypothetical protein